MIVQAIQDLLKKKDLKQDDAHKVMDEIMTGQATPSQIAGFLVALRAKGETVPEIAGCAVSMREASRRLSLHPTPLVDNCGTGGDGRNSLNISTAAAFVVSGAGYAVAKHGNRSISSKCGSADVLEILGVKVDCPLAIVEQSINEVGIGFMFAPLFHPAMKFAMPTRKELGLRTVFNVLGPITNPARAHVQIIGVFDPKMIEVIGKVIGRMGMVAGLVVHSEGWDEITLHGKTQVAEMMNGQVKTYSLTAKDFGLPKVPAKYLEGGDAEHNARIITEILENKNHPAKNVVLANAAALIWITERGFFKKKKFTLKEAVARANESLASGAAFSRLQKMAEVTHTIE